MASKGIRKPVTFIGEIGHAKDSNITILWDGGRALDRLMSAERSRQRVKITIEPAKDEDK